MNKGDIIYSYFNYDNELMESNILNITPIKKNDIILTTPNSFIATANCIVYANGIPDFVDINEDDYIWDDKRDCFKVKKCLDRSCSGEEVTRISAIKRLKDLINEEKFYGQSGRFRQR